MSRLLSRLKKLESVIGEPERRAAECRARARGIIEMLTFMDLACGLTPEQMVPIDDDEAIRVHDRVREVHDLPPIGEVP